MENRRYNGLDGLRGYAAIGIVLMHVMLNGFELKGFVANRIIAQFGEFVYLFMIVSAFSLCCGYYEKIASAQITPAKFYAKRVKRILPFFALLCIMDFAVAPSVKSAMELFADLTLCFGLLPNPAISVIGIGWFVGLVFVFYITFPFFCTLIASKRRAWLAFAASIAFSMMCRYYFFDSAHMLNFDYRGNIVYTAPYFFAGGLIFLYKDSISKLLVKFKYLVLLLCIGAAAIFIWQGSRLWTALPMFALFTIYALREKSPLLENKLTSFLSGISMEIYLCHMMFFRLLEKVGLTKIFANDLLSYIVSAAASLTLAIAFSFAFNKILKVVESKKLWRKN